MSIPSRPLWSQTPRLQVEAFEGRNLLSAVTSLLTPLVSGPSLLPGHHGHHRNEVTLTTVLSIDQTTVQASLDTQSSQAQTQATAATDTTGSGTTQNSATIDNTLQATDSTALTSAGTDTTVSADNSVDPATDAQATGTASTVDTSATTTNGATNVDAAGTATTDTTDANLITDGQVQAISADGTLQASDGSDTITLSGDSGTGTSGGQDGSTGTDGTTDSATTSDGSITASTGTSAGSSDLDGQVQAVDAGNLQSGTTTTTSGLVSSVVSTEVATDGSVGKTTASTTGAVPLQPVSMTNALPTNGLPASSLPRTSTPANSPLLPAGPATGAETQTITASDSTFLKDRDTTHGRSDHEVGGHTASATASALVLGKTSSTEATVDSDRASMNDRHDILLARAFVGVGPTAAVGDAVHQGSPLEPVSLGGPLGTLEPSSQATAEGGALEFIAAGEELPVKASVRSAALLGSPLAFDLDLLVQEAEQFFEQIEQMSQDLAAVLARVNLLSGAVAVGVSATAAAVARWRLQRGARNLVFEGCAGKSFTWYPGIGEQWGWEG